MKFSKQRLSKIYQPRTLKQFATLFILYFVVSFLVKLLYWWLFDDTLDFKIGQILWSALGFSILLFIVNSMVYGLWAWAKDVDKSDGDANA